MAPIAETSIDGVEDLCISSRERKSFFTGRIKDGDRGSEPARTVIFVFTSKRMPEIIIG